MFTALMIRFIMWLQAKAMLRKCLVKEEEKPDQIFEFKGKIYDRKKYVRLKAKDFRGYKREDIENQIASYKSGLIQSKQPDLDSAIIDAYQIAMAEARK